MPEQWEEAPPEGYPCVFCDRPIGTEEEARAMWDLDQGSGWQVLAFHLACRDRAERDRSRD